LAASEQLACTSAERLEAPLIVLKRPGLSAGASCARSRLQSPTQLASPVHPHALSGNSMVESRFAQNVLNELLATRSKHRPITTLGEFSQCRSALFFLPIVTVYSFAIRRTPGCAGAARAYAAARLEWRNPPYDPPIRVWHSLSQHSARADGRGQFDRLMSRTIHFDHDIVVRVISERLSRLRNCMP